MNEVLPRQPIRQRVLSLPFAPSYLLATRPEVVTQVLGIAYRACGAYRPLARALGAHHADIENAYLAFDPSEALVLAPVDAAEHAPR